MEGVDSLGNALTELIDTVEGNQDSVGGIDRVHNKSDSLSHSVAAIESLVSKGRVRPSDAEVSC